MTSFAPEPDPPPGYLSLVRVSRRAMATEFEVAFPLGTPAAAEAGEAALDLIDDLEATLTVYRGDSEVSRLHRAGGGVASPALFDLLARCATLAQETGGAFDPAVGALVKCWGFHRREGRVPAEAELTAAAHAGGMRHVALDAAARSVRFRRPGVELNFGAVGKGFALDRAAALLREEWGVRAALLHGGGSSVYALGAPPTDPRGWRVAVRHPTGGGPLGAVLLKDAGFGTSAATYQHFEHAGKTYGHVLDPRTGRPAEAVRSASCRAPTAADADALSTAFFVAGAAWAADYCRHHAGVGAVVLPPGTDAAAAYNLGTDWTAPPPAA